MENTILILLGLVLCTTAYRYPTSFNNNILLKIEQNNAEIDTRTCRIPDMNDLNVEGPDTPSPLTVNECLEEGLERDGSNCPSLNCTNNCLLPDLDSRGCLMSCSCKSSGLWGDIMLTEEDVSMLESNRAGSRNLKRWMETTGTTKHNRKVYVIYYTYASSITGNSRARQAIDAARAAYYKDTCLLFYPKPDDFKGDYIQFFSGQGCYSFLGRRNYGMQKISIGRGCEHKGIVMHEMMHAMGFWHEQARPDRDEYVSINWGNIKDGRDSQFSKVSTEHVNSFGSPYDMGSIMQYDGMSFNKNGRPTIIDKKTGKMVKGQREGFSDQDIAQIRAMYDCDNM